MAVFEWGGAKIVGATTGISLNADADAQVVGQMVEDICEANGTFVPRELWTQCKGKGHELHEAFEWNNKQCGDKYRDEQARMMGRCIRVVTLKDDDTHETRPLVIKSKPDKEGNGYKLLTVAMGNKDDREYILNQALAGLKQWRKKWSDLNTMAKAYDTVKAVDFGINKLMEAVASEEFDL